MYKKNNDKIVTAKIEFMVGILWFQIYKWLSNVFNCAFFTEARNLLHQILEPDRESRIPLSEIEIK